MRYTLILLLTCSPAWAGGQNVDNNLAVSGSQHVSTTVGQSAELHSATVVGVEVESNPSALATSVGGDALSSSRIETGAVSNTLGPIQASSGSNRKWTNPVGQG